MSQNWQLEWSDEFNGTSLDLTKWSYEIGTGVNGDFGTGQLDRATDRPENVAIEQGISGADGGALRISTRKETYMDRNYTSGRINTQGKYGWGPNHRIVARIWPKGVRTMGQGFAFWLMPNEVPAGQSSISWPQGGEVDIMEYVGSIPSHNLGTVHYAWDWNNNSYADWNHGGHGAYYSYADQQVPDSPEWIQIDLGSNQSVGRVNINWENTGRSFQIQLSTNGTTWNTVYSTTAGPGGVQDITFGAQTARYVRMYGTQRNNAWGYSIYEFQVFSSGSSTNLALNKATSASSVQGADVASNFAVDGSVTTRWSSSVRNPQYQCCAQSSTTDPYVGANGWHTYGINWYEDRLEFFIDDNVYHIHYFNDGGAFAVDGQNQNDIFIINGKRVMKSEYSNLYAQWHPFEHEMYAILSAGVGGSGNTYGGPIVDQAVFPTDVYIDWVRVYNNGVVYNPPPTVSLTAPTGTETYWAPASVTLSATAADTKGGTISSVAFYDGTALIGTDNSAPYSITLNNMAAGVHKLTAVATDNGGKTATSGAVSVAVNDANSNLALNRPGVASSVKGANGANLAFDGDVASRWESLDAIDPSWIYVDLGNSYNVNRVKITWETAAGKDYQIQVTDNPNGTWTTIKTVTGNAVFVNDLTGLSGKGRYVRMYGTARTTAYAYSIFQMEVYGTGGNSVPTVSITSPANGATFTAPATISIAANASDADGSISQVEFFNGSTSLGIDNTSPYAVTWSNVAQGNYTITAVATDNSGAKTTSAPVGVTVNTNTGTNLALNKTATASSAIGGNLASYAFDGNAGSRWESTQGVDPQWIYVDLGASYNVNRVKITWETAAGKDYQVQVTDNPSGTWTTIRTVTGNAILSNDLTSLSGTGRYVRMYGTARTTGWGYSIFEMEVYGTPGTNVPVTGVTVSPTTATVNVGATTQLTATVAPSNATNKNVTWTTSNAAVATVNASGLVTGVAAGNATITVTTQDGNKTANCAVTVSSAPVTNLALNKTGTASSAIGGNIANYAFDGDINSRWESTQGVDPQWIYVDLGASYTISRVKITWETASGKDYQIQVTDNPAGTWTAIKTVTGNATLVNDLTGLSGTGRYVRMYGTARTTGWGYSIFQMEVYGSGGGGTIVNLALNKASTASSSEAGNTAANANDGNTTGTRWSASSGTYPQWWRVDLGATYGLTTCDIYWLDGATKSYKYKIEVSTDDANYTTIVDKSTNTTAYTKSTDNLNVNARYVRVSISGASAGWASMFDVQVFGNNTPKSGQITNEFAVENFVEVYPVPMRDYVNIRLKGDSYKRLVITDITGKVVKIENKLVENQILRIGTNDLKNGIYFLRIEGNQSTVVKKLIK